MRVARARLILSHTPESFLRKLKVSPDAFKQRINGITVVHVDDPNDDEVYRRFEEVTRWGKYKGKDKKLREMNARIILYDWDCRMVLSWGGKISGIGKGQVYGRSEGMDGEGNQQGAERRGEVPEDPALTVRDPSEDREVLQEGTSQGTVPGSQEEGPGDSETTPGFA